MTTYNTGNPIGSTDPRDLYDNAENLDTAMNTPAMSWTDRLGNARQSWAGATGYQHLGDYASGIQVTTYNQVIRASGEYWRAAAGTVLPYTTTGAGMPESGKFVSVGDAVLRGDLVYGDGSSLVGFQQSGTGAVVRTAQDKLRERVSFKDFGAVGDGVADDTAQIQMLLDTPFTMIEVNDGCIFRVTSTLVSSIDDRKLFGGGWIVCQTPEAQVLEIRGARNKVSVKIDGENKARTGVTIPAGYGDDYDITGCHIRNLRSDIQQAFGIVIWSTAQGRISGNVIEDVYSSGDSGGPSISNGLARGIQIVPSAPIVGSVEVSRNIIRRIYGEEGDAISVQIADTPPFPSSKVYIAHNMIENWSRRAIKVQCAGAMIFGNYCISDDAIAHARTSNAISIIASDNCSVTENEIRCNNKFVGISVSGDGAGRNVFGNTVRGNCVSAPRDAGILVGLAESTSLTGNTVTGVDISPISVADSPATSVIGNILTAPVISGSTEQIVLADSPRSVVADNIINANTIYRGIRISSQGSVVEGNKILVETIQSAAFGGPGGSSLSQVDGSIVIGNYVRNVGAAMFINFGGASTLKLALNNVLGAGAMDTGISTVIFSALSSPSISMPGQSFNLGDMCINGDVSSGQPSGWICTAKGTPGTWAPLGTIA